MESWKKIEGFSNYSISNYGRIRNDKLNRFLEGRPTIQYYIHVCLTDDDGNKKEKYIHRLVASAFCENPNNHNEVDHIDGRKNNNDYTNLRFVSRNENSRNKKKRENCSSKYIGVCRNKNYDCWTAQLTVSKKKLYLGNYPTEEQAFDAFKKKVSELNLQDFYRFE